MSQEPQRKQDEVCPLCETPVYGEAAQNPLYTEDGPKAVHYQCMLREVIGGIGHLVAHEWWCVRHHDPDAGLTYRQSALLADAWTHIVGLGRNEEDPMSENHPLPRVSIEHTLLNTDDAMVWATEFCRIFAGKVITAEDAPESNEIEQPVGPGIVVGWFANAMETAKNLDERRREIETDTAPVGAVPQVMDEGQKKAFVEGFEEGRSEEPTKSPTDLDDPTKP